MITMKINGQTHEVDVEEGIPLLWVVRDVLNFTGTKYGCGVGACGACTVHVDGEPVRSCSFPAVLAQGKEIVTIEGLQENGVLHKVQQAWIDAQAPQCGYCQSGQIMAAVALLKVKPQPTDEEIDAAMTNICRCGAYTQIRAAIHAAAKA
ncbi:MAG: (2Fe-2S)-binding protein [Micropepsaceae bacterium]